MNWFTKLFRRKPAPVTVINYASGGPVSPEAAQRIAATMRRHVRAGVDPVRMKPSYQTPPFRTAPSPAPTPSPAPDNSHDFFSAAIIGSMLGSHSPAPAPSESCRAPSFSSGSGGDYGGGGASGSWGSGPSSSSSDSSSSSSSDSSSSSSSSSD